jgi:hypothetical protein
MSFSFDFGRFSPGKKIDRIPETTAQQMNSSVKAKELRAKLPQTEAVQE